MLALSDFGFDVRPFEFGLACLGQGAPYRPIRRFLFDDQAISTGLPRCFSIFPSFFLFNTRSRPCNAALSTLLIRQPF